MAYNNPNGGNRAIYFIVGALVVAVIGFGIYYFGGYAQQDQADISITMDENGMDVDTN